MNKAISKEHVVWLDIVRFVAMFTVVCCHCVDPFNFCSNEMPADVIEVNKFWGAVYGSFLRPCVPLFVMITGALLLPVRSEPGVFYKKRICRVFWPFLIWSVLYSFTPWIVSLLGYGQETVHSMFSFMTEESASQSLGSSLMRIINIPFDFSHFDVHMWYIYMLIGLYLYLPIFSAWVEKASDKAKLWFLAAWCITTLLPYYLEYVSPYLWGTCTWNSFGMLYYFAGFNGYLLLGHYLSHRDWSWRKLLSIGIPLFAVGYAVTFFGFCSVTALPGCDAVLYELFITYNSLNVVMMTIPVFMLCKKVNVSNMTIRRVLANLTVCGFGIYMIHYFFTTPSIGLMRLIGVPISLQIPAAAVVAFGVSWLLVLLIRRLAGKKAKYIVG